MPRANKGERVVVTGRLPVSYYRKLDRYVNVTHETKTAFITDAVMRALDEMDIEDINPQQGQLKLSA